MEIHKQPVNYYFSIFHYSILKFLVTRPLSMWFASLIDPLQFVSRVSEIIF